jgi:hypothetical protein
MFKLLRKKIENSQISPHRRNLCKKYKDYCWADRDNCYYYQLLSKVQLQRLCSSSTEPDVDDSSYNFG